MISREAVLDALTGVRDPELDEPVTALGFVSEVDKLIDVVADLLAFNGDKIKRPNHKNI